MRRGVSRLGLALLLLLAPPAPAAWSGARLEHDATLVWRDPDPRFGGLSGLAVSPDGGSLLAISDRAAWARADLARTPDGQLTGLRTTGIGPLLAISGAGLTDDEVDAEGLAVDADGRAFVSFEGFDRIRRYDDIAGPASSVPGHPAFDRLQRNSALEALAIDAEGRLYAIPERSGRVDRPFPVWRFDNGSWERWSDLRRDGPYLVVGADIGPDGRLYVLERDFRWVAFSSRIRRFEIGPDGLMNEETLLETALGDFQNMEGISVWRDAGGTLRVTLIADDNFHPLQRTEIAEFRLVED